MIEAGIVEVKEKDVRKKTHETIKTLMWSDEYRSNMSEAMEMVRRYEKQTRALLAFSSIRSQKNLPISRYEVMTKSDTDHATIRALLKKGGDRKSTRLNSSHVAISYAVFCLEKTKISNKQTIAKDRANVENHVQSI